MTTKCSLTIVINGSMGPEMAENAWVIGVKKHPTYKGPHFIPLATGRDPPSENGEDPYGLYTLRN